MNITYNKLVIFQSIELHKIDEGIIICKDTHFCGVDNEAISSNDL